ncbi:MAG: hypothetical protein OCD00_02830 [Colwellia sp.]
MKYSIFLPCLFIMGCASTNYDPLFDDKISQNPMCQSTLQILVENDAFTEVKSLIDRECSNIVVKGWVKGKISNRFDKRCKASFRYLAERPALLKVAKKFVKNACYPENPDKFYWKPIQSVAKNG